jgi:alpha-amylase
MAIVLTNGGSGDKWMNVFRPNAKFRDHTGHITDTIPTDVNGWANFRCNGGSVSVWLQE